MNTRRLKPISIFLLCLSILTLISCSEVETYTITFDTQTDAQIGPIVAYAGQAIYAPEEPVREGYQFDGWMDDDDIFYFGTMPEENIELTAKWRKIYTVNFNSNGGSIVNSVQVVEGEDIVLPDPPKKDHFKFTGWTYMGEPFELTTMPSSNIILTATWIEASTISFVATVYDRHLDEYVEIEVEEIVEVAGEEIQAPMAPEYEEYEFKRWIYNGSVYDFTTMPEGDITLTADWYELSNLPALFIDIYDEDGDTIPIQYVNRENYVTTSISLVNTTDEFELSNVAALFKGRGNGSWIDSGDKRGYRIKFDEEQSLFGNHESRHWVILANSNFDDVTMYRNKLAFNMADEVFTEIDYVTSAEWVDVYFNGNYHGVYLVAEHLRVDEGRVDIESEFGVNDTGYLIEYDSYASGVNGVDYFTVPGVRYPFSMRSPNPDDYLEEGYTLEEYKAQVSYIQAMVAQMVSSIMSQDFEAFSNVADVESFVDMYILHELFKNIDTGYSSFFIYRDPGGKLTAGPPWDFDATLGSSPERGNGSPAGIYVGLSVQAFSSRTANEMLITLYATPEFKDEVIQRWQELSPEIQAYVDETLTDEMIETYRYAMGRNFVRWPTPQGFGPEVDQDTAEENWANNIVIARNWLTDRVTWLDEEWS